MENNKLISVATVLYNSEDVVESYIIDVLGVISNEYKYYELLLIDNGSTDDSVKNTKKILKKYKQIRLIVLSRMNDEQVAWTAALENCIGDFVVLMDINTDPPDLIPEMVKYSFSGCDIVTAETKNKKSESFAYRFLSKIFLSISNILTEHKIDLNWSNYVCYSRKVVDSLTQVKNRIRYLKYLKLEIGYSHYIIQYDQINRTGRKLKKPLLNRFFFALETIFSSSDIVMKIVTTVALVVSLINFTYALFAIGIKILNRDPVGGWASTSVVLSIMFSILFFLLFIIGQYISIIYKENKKSPLYYIAEEFTNTNIFDDFKDKNVYKL